MYARNVVALVVAIVVTFTTAPHAGPQDEGGRVATTRPTPLLTVTATPVWPNNYGTVIVGNALLQGKTTRTYIAVGSSEFPNPCALSGGDVRAGSEFGPAGALVTWLFEARLVSSDRSGARVALHWTRSVHDPAAVDAESIDRSYEVSLGENDQIVLDLVRPRDLARVSEFGRTTCEGMAIQLGLKFQDPPELESALLAYDIWLLQTDGTGRQFVDRVQPRGFQGRDTEYAFGRQQYDTDGTRSAAGPIAVSLSGRVKGRVRHDGRIDLVVGLGRTAWVGSLGQGDGGLKQETVGDGETIELAIPRIGQELKGVPQDSKLYRTSTAIRVTVRRVS